MFAALVLLFLYQPAEGAASPITCYNEKGQAVDWFYLYKLPKRSQSKDPLNGMKYLLMESGNKEWTEGKMTVNSSTGALGNTVGQLYSQKKNLEVAYILYNDQRPSVDVGDGRMNGGNSRSGHTKGVVLLDKTQGFWLVHSTPCFPPVQQAGEYHYPDSGLKNGQNFLCVTYPLKQFQTIGEQLQINQPDVYDCNVPEALADMVPSLAAVCSKHRPHKHTFSSVKLLSNRSVTLTSLHGTDFISFAKGASFHKDLYHAWVAPTLQSDLLVQFWIHTTHIRPSNCSQGWSVFNIKVLSLEQDFSFQTSQDHSKWAVSTEAAGFGSGGAGGGWICVGDINRNQAEEKRGGGTVCLRDPSVWKAYRMAVWDYKKCEGRTSNGYY